MIIEVFNYLFIFNMFLALFFVFRLKNPIYSLLSLILLFILSGLLLFFYELEFLGFIFIIVYVGAITILFLFILMMISTKKEFERRESALFYIINSFFFIFLPYFIHVFFINECFYNAEFDFILSFFETSLIEFDHVDNLEIMGQILFNYFGIPVLICGIILLVALVGCIALTLDFKKETVSRDEILPRTSHINKFF